MIINQKTRLGMLLGATVAALALLISCTSTQPYTKQVKTAMSTCEVVLIVPQSTLEVVVQESNGDGSLLGAVVSSVANAVRLEKAQKAAAPILAELEDYDIGAKINEFLAEELQSVGFVFEPADFSIETDNSQMLQILESTATDAVLFVKARHVLEGKTIRLEWNAIMYPKADSLRPFMVNPKAKNLLKENGHLFNNNYAFTNKAVKAANVQEKLDESIRTLSARLAKELGNPVD